ncbi:uncharacterized protein Bfra_001634 [Botrytis fragariae]|uniref:Uncharacterized protein n=1 Tax=Botrytis fragariae TaxID=1964551 RepID=A0A8H6B1A9_9HELO|nr:uncharacterized protein Bfra_001634 [Botrytis fragariae]KAF5877267.1 hypothetical protein Bfra_001634 [Botrytis fragariae]
MLLLLLKFLFSVLIEVEDLRDTLGFVASERPTFKPTSTNYENTCTTTCFDSVDTYLKGIQESCTADGDAAQEYVGGTSPEALVPVEIVAQVFQHTLARYCTTRAQVQFSSRIDFAS